MLGIFSCLSTVSCSKDPVTDPHIKHVSNKVILDWNEIAYHAFGGSTYQNSLQASRINAMTHLAMHDAVNATDPRFGRYVYQGDNTGANPVAAAATAAYEVLVHEISEKKLFLDSALQKSLAGIAEGEAKNKGVLLGKEAGRAILLARANDGSTGNPIVPVTPGNTPGVYQAVPPFDFIFAPHWVNVKPFGIQSKDQFRPEPFPPIRSEKYTAAFKEVKEAGRLISAVRTADQTNYTRFWYEFSEAGWNRVARTIAGSRKLDLWETARLFALVDMALADAYIAGWEGKFHYNLWRPYTAIRNAKEDGNSDTSEDEQWESLMPAPPVQDYPSTHSALGNAAAAVMAGIVGDNTYFSMSSPTASAGNTTRSFKSLSEAANENADSRVRAGIHFRFACEAGQEMGNKLGNYILLNHLKPLAKGVSRK